MESKSLYPGLPTPTKRIEMYPGINSSITWQQYFKIVLANWRSEFVDEGLRFKLSTQGFQQAGGL